MSVVGFFKVKVTYRNVSKASFRLYGQVVYPWSDHIEDVELGVFWQVTLQEAATGKIYISAPPHMGPDHQWTVRPSPALKPGESMETIVMLPALFLDDKKQMRRGPAPTFSGATPYIPAGDYKVTVTLQFPPKPAPDGDPTPLWQGDFIQANTFNITVTPEPTETHK